jgi:hypothetical protein
MNNKKKTPIAFLMLMIASPAHALDAAIVKQLKDLSLTERREQRCDMEAMKRIAQEQKGFKPDKVIAYTFADPVETGNLVRAPGAAFRSGGEWYRLKFKCETGDRGLTVRSLKYTVGEKIPRDQWERFYLYD